MCQRWLKVWVKDRVYLYLGAERIGSHSLINKDSGFSWNFDQAMACAKAVHWHIINTLTRHLEPRTIRVSNQEKDTTTIDTRTYIDWHSLVKFFLKRPEEGIPTTKYRKIKYSKTHIVTEDVSLAGLSQRYGVPWEAIAKLNLGTSDKNEINRLLKNKAWGYPVKNGNYAFNPHLVPPLKLRIPDQIMEIPEQKLIESTWWKEIILKINWKYIKEDPSIEMSKKTISKNEFKTFIDEGGTFRENLKKEYSVKP